MKLTIHRGARQIGGNCVEVSTGSTRLILDVGSPLEDPAQLLSRPTEPQQGGSRVRPALPIVPGLFSEGPRIQAVLLSHAHGDHTGLLQWVRPEIPIYLSQGTSKMLMAGSIFAGQPTLTRNREVKMKPAQPMRIGDITVTGLPVDHSAFDSMALMLEADGKRLLYSGDLRLHGRKPGMARQLLQVTTEKPIDVLLMEGTNLREPGIHTPAANQTEAGLEESLLQVISRGDHLVLANFSPQHVDRMVSFYKATRRAGREFVVDPYGAFVLDLVSGQCRIPKPIAKNGIRIYYNQSFLKTWRKKNLKKVHDMFLANQVDLSAIRAEPERYVMLFRPSMTHLDFGGTFPEHTTCVYSYWAGYLVRPEYQALRSALAKVQGYFCECHTSGHIFGSDLGGFVNAINARLVIPMHTTVPDRFGSLFPNALALKDGETYAV